MKTLSMVAPITLRRSRKTARQPPAMAPFSTTSHALLAGQPCKGAASTSLAEKGAQRKSPDRRTVPSGRVSGRLSRGEPTQGARCRGFRTRPSASISIAPIWPTARSSETEMPFAPIVTVSMHASRESLRKKSLSNGGRASGAIGILHQGAANLWSQALPLIALPGISPRIVTGRKGLAAMAAPFLQRWGLAKPAMAAPLSPSLYGERMPAGR
ncbi:exported hypothetical protein [Mesorhizobium plurifarium]|uniref:Uncharacterized protein n=1 Tax=Mesorhizobium plurifarium TaxID=69974 RepID=A0A090F3U5_MESPL|nr:exported hypothetical protein [Mesorhizobium plurifarium]